MTENVLLVIEQRDGVVSSASLRLFTIVPLFTVTSPSAMCRPPPLLLAALPETVLFVSVNVPELCIPPP